MLQTDSASTDIHEGCGPFNSHQGNEEALGTKDPPKDVPLSPDPALDVIKLQPTRSTTFGRGLIDGGLSDPHKEQENEQAPGTESPSKDVCSSPDTVAIHADEKEEIVITSIRATNLALGLRRIPAGFHAMIHCGDFECKTKNIPVLVNNDTVDWRGPIPIPSDLTARVSLTVYASFEFQPVLGSGEQLQRLTVTVSELLDHSGKDIPFTFSPMDDGDVVCPCSSLLVTVGQQRCDSDNTVSRIPEPHSLGMEYGGKLEDVTNQAHSALSRYRKHGQREDLECATEWFQHALNICPLNHPCRAAAESNMGTAMLIRYRAHDSNASLEIPVKLYRNALGARPVGHPDRPSTLIQLAAVHLAKSEKRWDEADKAQVGALLEEAVALSSPESHEQRAAVFMMLLHVERATGTVQARSQSSVPTPPLTDVDPWALSVQLLDLFQKHGDLADLQLAISVLEGSIKSISRRDRRYLTGLTNLAVALLYRFDRLGDLADLREAISRQQEAVNLTPDGHPDKHTLLNNLGNSFLTRFRRLGKIKDLGEAISRQQEAVDLTPDDHPHKHGYLNNPGSSFLIRFQRLGEMRDLEEGMLRQQEAVNLTPNGHPSEPRHLNNLGASFKTRCECLGEMRDLEEAISRQQEAVDLIPNGHPDRPACLSNLGKSFLTRFRRLGEIRDLEEAISRQQDAVDLTPNGHPDKPGCLSSLGNSFLARFKRFGTITSLQQAILPFSLAACAPAGPVTVRFRASRKWIYCVRLLPHESPLHAYSIAINLLPQLAWIGLSLGHRYRELVRASYVVRDAAAAAVDSGHTEVAVEWLEQGRSIVWGELLQLRSSYDELAAVHPDRAHRLRELSAALEHAGSTREKSLSEQSDRDIMSLQFEADQHRKLAIERDRLLQDIRRLPDFERFLLRKEFSTLRASAHSGLVVILNAAKLRCDALIILANVDHVIHVPLPNFTFDQSMEHQTYLQKFVRDASEDRYGYPIEEADARATQWKALLSSLWKCVVKPVLDALAFSQTPGDLSRVFWCPTGPLTFLPIHAAGLYDATHDPKLGRKVFDFVISSYIPNLGILAVSYTSNTTPSSDLRLLAVCQPPSDGLAQLPGVVDELEHIKTVIRNSPSARIALMESSVGTVEEVLTLMKEADWVHFACHGIQDDGNLTNSGLCLANERRLRISDIVSLSRPHGGLAFLSACQTAKGDKVLSDEAVHIAAGMLFAGYGGVVGTMWSINDKVAPNVAKDVYEHLFCQNDTGASDYREAARALHVAVGRLRENNVSFERWLPFIHVGL